MSVLEDIILRRSHPPLDRRFKDNVRAASRNRPTTGRRCRVAGSVRVADNTNPLSIRLVGGEIVMVELTYSGGVLSTHPVPSVRGGCLVSMNDHAVALADTNGERIYKEGLDRHHVRCDNFEHMIVNGEMKVEVRPAIDDVNEIFLARLESLLEVCTTAVVAAGAVDDDRIGRRRTSTSQRCVECLVCVLVVPVSDNDGIPFFVPIVVAGSMDE